MRHPGFVARRAMNNSGWNAYVFRDGRQTVSGAELLSSLAGALKRWWGAPEQNAEDCALASLIAAGELECALLDDAEGSPTGFLRHCRRDH